MEKRLHRFDVLVRWFEERLIIGEYRPRSIEEYLREVRVFRGWLEKSCEVEDIDELTKTEIHAYLSYLYQSGFATATIHKKSAILRGFLKQLYEENKLYTTLYTHIKLPRIHRTLPKNILNTQEIGQIFTWLEGRFDRLSFMDYDTVLFLRNYAIFEILYGTGMRRSELLNLMLEDLDYSERYITIREGKGGKSRVVPLGRKALIALKRYVREARLLLSPQSNHLFISCRGNPLDRESLLVSVKKIVQQSGVKKPVTIHGLRHACATHMLNNGADIRHIQELLGHADLSTTQIYTHISIENLKEKHAKHHPRESGAF